MPNTSTGAASQPAAAGPAAVATPIKPDGPVAAVMIATGIGMVVLGLLTTLGEASESVADFLKFSDRVGPLSGKTILAVAAFLLSWAGLHVALRNREVNLKPAIVALVIMFAVAMVLVFPPFFQLFESD